jgi:hypothetical protein
MLRVKKTTSTSVPARPKTASGTATARTSKSSDVLALLARDQGASIADIVAATGWLPHTARGALTGLRKKGHAIARVREADVTTYRLLEQVQ